MIDTSNVRKIAHGMQTEFVTRNYYDSTGDNGIGWCGDTLNFFRGCQHVPGRRACDHCYAAFLAQIQESNPVIGYRGLNLAALIDGERRWTGKISPGTEDIWTRAFRTRHSGLYFVDSMSDYFYEGLSDERILLALQFLDRARWHTFQLLTKRHVRMRRFMSRLYRDADGMLALSPKPLPVELQALVPNLWIGTTVEDQKWADIAIPYLLKVNAAVRFLSVEPQMEHVNIRRYLHGVDWVICGGESGTGWRPMELDWARSLRDQCAEAGVPFFFKQFAGSKPELLPELDGVRWPWLPRRPLIACPPEPERRELVSWAVEQYRAQIAPWAAEVRASADVVQLGLGRAIPPVENSPEM